MADKPKPHEKVNRALQALKASELESAGDAMPVTSSAGRVAAAAPGPEAPASKRGRRDYERLSIDLDPELYRQLKQRGVDLAVPVSAIMQALIEDYLAGRAAPRATNPQAVWQRRRRQT